MNSHSGRVRAADRALVASPSNPQAVSTKGFDPSRYEAYRPALIAFHAIESPWLAGSLESLRKGWPMNDDNRRTIRALVAAMEAM